MKPASYRISLLAGCAFFILGAASGAFASTPQGQDPSIEIHLDVLNHLADTQAPKTLMPAATAAAAAPTGTASDASPFGQPSAPLKASEKTAAAHTQPKAQHVASHAPKHKVKVASKAKPRETAKETVVADAAPPAPKDNDQPPALNKSAELPPEKPAKAASDADAVPKPDLKSMNAAPAPQAALPLATPPDVPELADTGKPAITPKPSIAADVKGGVADLLEGDDASSKAPAARPAEPATPVVAAAPPPARAALPPVAEAPKPAALPEAPPAMAAATPSAPPPALPASLATPPADLVTAAPVKDNLPSAPAADAPLTLSKDTPKDTGKMVMASNDLPPPAPPMMADAIKPDLPSSPDKDAAPMQMAQSTMVPLAIPPAVPETPAAAAKPPEMPPALGGGSGSAPVATVASSGSGATPEAGEAPPGATPDLVLVFNESETDVPLGSTAKLDALAAQLNSNPAARITIMAYASGPETTGIYPKRVSLARGIAVRNYLTSTKGVDIERVNVKALGNKNPGGGPGDRVDLFVLK